MADDTYKVIKICLISRLFVVAFQCASNMFITDYDSSSSVFSNDSTVFDHVTNMLFQGFTNWDSVYFIEIADKGYQYEQYMAFFPMYPMIIRLVSSHKLHFIPWHYCLEKRRSILMIVGSSLSSIFFTIATVALYKLSRLKFQDPRIALFSSILFCINPAVVFMNGIYSESMYACLLFTGIYFFERSSHCYWSFIGLIMFALSSATRSNGILSCGFVSYFLVKKLMNSLFYQVYPVLVFKPLIWKNRMLSICHTAFTFVISNGIILLPFFIFQFYGYYLFCNISLKLPPWCNKTMPLPYSYIQDHYWNVGFLRYFEVKQIPNFVLALPMFILCVGAITEFMQGHNSVRIVLTLGFWQDKIPTDKSRLESNPDHSSERCAIQKTFHSPDVFVYIVHLLFLTVFAVTCIHVQVLTRMIASSSPIIYWYSAHVIARQQSIHSKLILGYFIAYSALGIILHCNFYPWT